MSKRAVILAGGQGSRLRPYTATIPKPLVPIGDMPILEIVVRQLASFGFNEITIAVGHQSEMIREYFGSGSKWKVTIDYSVESSPRGTMGPLKLIDNHSDNFLILNGDVLTDLDYSKIYNFHIEKNNLFTIASYKRKQITDFGVIKVSSDGLVTSFEEKPALDYTVSMGVYAASKKILDHIPGNRPFGFDQLVIDLINKNLSPSTYIHDGRWLDIGRLDDYHMAIDEFMNNRQKYL